jgi:hypothetical protein
MKHKDEKEVIRSVEQLKAELGMIIRREQITSSAKKYLGAVNLSQTLPLQVV